MGHNCGRLLLESLCIFGLCSMNGVTFNPEKFVFARDEVDHVGFRIIADTVKPGTSFINAT